MKRIYEPEVTSLWCTGDLHGNFEALRLLVKEHLENAALVVCGDIALGFAKPDFYRQLMKRLGVAASQKNCYLYFIRGNHDDPSYFGTGVVDLKRVKAIPDYSVIRTGSTTMLCVGGGLSMDRTDRQEYDKQVASRTWYSKDYRKTWWEGEMPVYDEKAIDGLKAQGILVNTVASHAAPRECPPHTKEGMEYWMEYDKDLAKDNDAERDTMSMIRDRLLQDGHPVKRWYYGHYHFHEVCEIGGISYATLDMVRNYGSFDMMEVWKTDTNEQ